MMAWLKKWKKGILLPLLCAVLVLAAGCGASGASDPGQDVRQEPESALEQETEEDTEENDSGGEDALQEDEYGSGAEEADALETGSLQDSQSELDENGIYTSAEDVALYLHTYGKLPLNFITKKEARSRGWSGGSLEEYAPGMCIGGDRFGNYEGILPDGNYHECDINTLGKSKRGAERLIYSDDGRIYYTGDHYETFTLLYGQE